MAHQQQIDFCRYVRSRFPRYFAGSLVIDIGSLDINGNNQYLFEDCLYIGVDLLPGRNVDLASKGHELQFPSESVDVIVSTECFEHDPFYALTLRNIARMLKPGGLLLFTCATTGRAEHGTRRTTPEDAPLTQEFGDWSDYYKNLEEGDIREALDVDGLFESYAFAADTAAHDLYFWGLKKGDFVRRHDYSFQLQQDHLRTRLDEREDFILALLGAVNRGNAAQFDLKRIVTHHGTVLFLPPGSGGLRHGPLTASLSNIVLARQGGQGYLLHLAEERSHVVRLPAQMLEQTEEMGWSSAGAEAGLDIVPVTDAIFGLRSQGLYLCAEPSGAVTLSRPWLDQWESFAAITP